jgi:hypothetical protein
LHISTCEREEAKCRHFFDQMTRGGTVMSECQIQYQVWCAAVRVIPPGRAARDEQWCFYGLASCEDTLRMAADPKTFAVPVACHRE